MDRLGSGLVVAGEAQYVRPRHRAIAHCTMNDLPPDSPQARPGALSTRDRRLRQALR